MTAHCADLPKWLFFPDQNERLAYPHRVAAAKAVCAGCPEQLACYRGAVERGEQYGIWAGVTFRPTHHKTAAQKQCGTDAGYNTHLRQREPTCPDCDQAHNLREQMREEGNQNAS